MDIPDNKKDEPELSEADQADADVLETARKRFQLCVDAENQDRTLALEDLKFSAGQQWDTNIKNARHEDGRPTLTINRMSQFVHQIVNEIRQNNASIKVNPIDDNANQDTAKIFQGLIRHIEYDSRADIAYTKAADWQVRTGLGYFRIVPEYSDPSSFNQDLKIKSIPNRFTVYLDPHSTSPDGSDAEFGFVIEHLTPDVFEKTYKKAEGDKGNDWKSIGDNDQLWFGNEMVTVAEYFYKDYVEDEVVLFSNGQSVLKSTIKGEVPEGFEVKDTRKTLVPVVKWCKISGIEILEKRDLPIRHIPIIPVIGEETIIDGKRILEGIVRHAKDSQRMYNYFASAEAEAIALAPRAPFIGIEGQFEGHEQEWANANRRNYSFLQYKPITLNGQLVATPPQRQIYEPPTQAITQARSLASDDLKATTGIYDAALGNRSNENSGVAIQRRATQAQTSNFHYNDNLNHSIRHAGRILVDWIPFVYDGARTVRIIGDEGEETLVRINELTKIQGQDRTIRFDIGKYDVAVDIGPSFATKRQEAVAAMLDFTKAMPQQATIISDLLVKNMDWLGSKEMAERLKKALPPGIAEPDDKDKQPIPPQVQAQMQQQQQMIDQLTQHLKEKTELVNMKTIELESKERIAFAQMQTNAEIELAKIGSKESQTLLMHQISEIQHRLDLLHTKQPIQGNNPEPPQQAVPQEMNQPIGGVSPSTSMEQP